jgi:hypothetical protein
VGLPVVIGAGSVKPEDAASNLAARAHLLGFEPVPGWLLSPSVDKKVIALPVVTGAIYAFAVWPIPQIRERHNADTKSKLKYLSQRDSELGSAIISMARCSARGRWYAAQHFVSNGERYWRTIFISDGGGRRDG